MCYKRNSAVPDAELAENLGLSKVPEEIKEDPLCPPKEGIYFSVLQDIEYILLGLKTCCFNIF